MYDYIYNEMVDAEVAEPLSTPLWLDRDGKECDESESLGCMVTHKLKHPDICFVGDEVGGNISMKGDGNAGGKKLCKEHGTISYERASTTDKRFTMIGLTSLDGKPVMCVLIIQGKEPNLLVETGIDVTINPDGKPDDMDFFFNNSGEGKYFPGGPVCEYRGKKVPAMIRWNESATITSDILVDMLKTLDFLDVIPREGGKKPFLLIDGHQSRLELPFLKYINTPQDHWVVCIGVPYGTALWQVGDSKEQNGSFNIAMTKAKQHLLEYKSKHTFENPSLQATDMIPLINKAWKQSFARVSKNRNAIANRGWNPLNRNLLLDPSIRATMTDAEKIEEQEASCDIHLPSSFNENIERNNETSTNTTDTTLTEDTQQPTLNFSSGTSLFCLTSIVSKDQLMKARERIKKDQDDGAEAYNKLKSSKKLTAGVCYKNDVVRLGQSVFDVCKEKIELKKRELQEKIKGEEKSYLELKQKADAIIASATSINSLSNKDLSTILKSLKTKDDKKLPTRKKDMIELYHKWKDRPPRQFNLGDVNVSIEVDDSNIDDVAENNDPVQTVSV